MAKHVKCECPRWDYSPAEKNPYRCSRCGGRYPYIRDSTPGYFEMCPECEEWMSSIGHDEYWCTICKKVRHSLREFREVEDINPGEYL